MYYEIDNWSWVNGLGAACSMTSIVGGISKDGNTAYHKMCLSKSFANQLFLVSSFNATEMRTIVITFQRRNILQWLAASYWWNIKAFDTEEEI